MATVTTAPITLGPADHGRRLTLQEFLDADEVEGYRYELARGVVEVTHVPGSPHGMIVCEFYKAITLYGQAHPDVIQRFGGGNEIRFYLPGMVSGRNPDVAVILRNAPRDARRRRVASLAIEVVSEGSEARHRDYVAKREEYLAYGLHEYWIVDPIERRVTVLTRDGDAWTERVVPDGGVAEGLVLPGFRVDPAALWAAYEQGEVEEADGPEDAPA